MMSQHPETVAKRLLTHIQNQGGDNVKIAEEWVSTHVHPYVNRYFARVIAAQAMTLSEEPGTVKRGLNALLELREDLSLTDPSDSVDFESGWIDQALLGAYKTLGMDSEVKHIAASIVGRLMVSKILASESGPHSAQ